MVFRLYFGVASDKASVRRLWAGKGQSSWRSESWLLFPLENVVSGPLVLTVPRASEGSLFQHVFPSGEGWRQGMSYSGTGGRRNQPRAVGR